MAETNIISLPPARHGRRSFLFLQGPHGPFFARLARALARAGNDVARVGFNTGDRVFWPWRMGYIPFSGGLAAWPARFDAILRDHAVTDIVLYGDTRPVHAQAIARAEALGLRVHVFEEGYLRPYWVTYERGGANGNSRLMRTGLPEIADTLDGKSLESPEAPAHWGDMTRHIFYGMLYHFFVLVANWPYRRLRSHRALSVRAEFLLYFKRFLLLPVLRLERARATAALLRGGRPYHLALLQLDHDASFQAHSPFASVEAFVEEVIRGFARGAPAHHALVFKAHPLESGRVPMRRVIRASARRHGVAGRVHYIPGGKLARLLNHARTGVTVNSTAGQQVLWRGLPIKAFGDAVYTKPELASTQALPAFFAAPHAPDTQAYRLFRRYLLETSQVPGGFYSARGRRAILRDVIDKMLSESDPYESLSTESAAKKQSLHILHG